MKVCVWVIYDDNSDSYEGYSPPFGVFSTKKKAQEFVRSMNKQAGEKLYDPKTLVYAKMVIDERVGEIFEEG